MVKIDLGAYGSFVKEAEYQNYVSKALTAFDTLIAENGAGNDFLGWKTLPVDIDDNLISNIETIRDEWKAKGVELVIVIGIGGSYLGARCAIEALSHSFLRPEGTPQVVFAGNNLSEDYIAELLDLAKIKNTACVVISKSGTTGSPYLFTSTFSESSLPIGTDGSMILGIIIIIFVTFSSRSAWRLSSSASFSALAAT